jgi:acetyl-CoA C-acetyltransferase
MRASGGVDPRAACIVGVGSRTWHPADTGAAGAPEPLEMWEEVVRLAERDAGAAVLRHVDSLDVVYCQTWQYDDPGGRLRDRLGADIRRCEYSGIGGTTPQVLVQDAATRIARREADVALVVGGEALDTKRRFKKAGERYPYSFAPETTPAFPWEAPFHPAEVAHEVFQAWLTFALFDNARRGHLGVTPDEYRSSLGDLWHRFSEVAAANPEAWFPIERSPETIATPTPGNRVVATPYTKLMVSIMDVDMAAAILLVSHERADALGVPTDRRVYLRGWQYATDPVYVAEHPDLWRSPAMAAATGDAFRVAGVGIDDVAHLDLYSCFGSSVHFMQDALDLTPADTRPLTVTGGLPYHGGPGSNYLTHAIAQMARVLRDDPESLGLVTGVGMHMTKHVAGLYSTAPPSVAATALLPVATPEPATVPVADRARGAARVAAATVVYDRAGPAWGLAVCERPGDPRTRAYARIEDPDLLADAETTEWAGRSVHLVSHPGRRGVNLLTA